MKTCRVCHVQFETTTSQRRYCGDACRKLNPFRPAAEMFLDLIAREQGATTSELRSAFGNAGYAQGDQKFRFAVRALRVMLGDDNVICFNHKAGRYTLAASKSEAEEWITSLGAKRMRELRNVQSYADTAATKFGATQQGKLWAVVKDDITNTIRHFEYAMEHNVA